jgi:hypothetical protein
MDPFLRHSWWLLVLVSMLRPCIPPLCMPSMYGTQQGTVHVRYPVEWWQWALTVTVMGRYL